MTYLTIGIMVLIAALMLLGKEAPLRVLFGKLVALRQTPGPAPVELVAEPLKPQLPQWLNQPHDLQLMLLRLGHHAARQGNLELKDRIFDLLKAFADLDLAEQHAEAGTTEEEAKA